MEMETAQCPQTDSTEKLKRPAGAPGEGRTINPSIHHESDRQVWLKSTLPHTLLLESYTAKGDGGAAATDDVKSGP